MAWASLAALEAVKWNVESAHCLAFIFRQMEDKDQWILSVIMQNASECLNYITEQLTQQGLVIKRGFEKKRKILESEVTSKALKGIQIEALIVKIE